MSDENRNSGSGGGKGKKIAIVAVVCVLAVAVLVMKSWNSTVGRMTAAGGATIGGSTLGDMAAGAADTTSGAGSDPFSGGPSGSNSKSAGTNNGMQNSVPNVDTGSPQVETDTSMPMEDTMLGIDSMDPGDIPGENFNTEEYSTIVENVFQAVSAAPLSTFAADVDTASYTNIRRMILAGQSVPPDAVRIEEMINYFKYDYPAPDGNDPFSVTTEICDCPWNDDTKLLRIGVQAEQPEDLDTRKPTNLVFLIDVSGSMYTDDKLPLVQKAFSMLTENLGENDRVSMVTYAGSDSIVLEGATGLDGVEIREAIDGLEAGGSTYGSAGIMTAYDLAEKYFIENGNNRIILATDGDLNVGVTSEGDLKRLVEEKRKTGVFLSVLGFGTENIKDNKMETLADNGNGGYYYIDSELEAKRVLVEELGGTLNTVAKDVKFQVEFNPAYIKGYRLIGYENRLMAAEDFANDAKDGGEIGEGHRVTALYELVFNDSAMSIPGAPELKYQDSSSGRADTEEYLTVNVRYKAPNGFTSKLLTFPVGPEAEQAEMSDDFKFASCVAGAGMLLRQSEYAGDMTYSDITSMLKTLDIADDPYKSEFVYLVNRMAQISGMR